MQARSKAHWHTIKEKSCLPVRFVKSLVHLNEKAGRPLCFDHHHPVAPVIKKVIKEAAKENWLINLSFSNHACSNADQFVISLVWVCILLVPPSLKLDSVGIYTQSILLSAVPKRGQLLRPN